ncbi:MAG: hypothetical protein WBX77_24380, partial [Pseudolabrys sp.]
MRKLILTVIALGFTIGPAPAQSQIEKIAALNALSGEYLECAAYFSATAYCINGYPAPSVPKIVRDYQQAAKTALSRAISTGRVAGVTNSTAEAQSKPVGAAQRQSIKSNCLNISDLSERYDAFCKQLMQAPDRRVEELLSGRYCTGQYRCFLSANSAPPPLRTSY